MFDEDLNHSPVMRHLEGPRVDIVRVCFEMGYTPIECPRVFWPVSDHDKRLVLYLMNRGTRMIRGLLVVDEGGWEPRGEVELMGWIRELEQLPMTVWTTPRDAQRHVSP